jgi:hypothetical protein
MEALPSAWGFLGTQQMPDPYHTGNGIAETVTMGRSS